jgi:hypothetical protein
VGHELSTPWRFGLVLIPYGSFDVVETDAPKVAPEAPPISDAISLRFRYWYFSRETPTFRCPGGRIPVTIAHRGTLTDISTSEEMATEKTTLEFFGRHKPPF